jgi:hypothetical protein
VQLVEKREHGNDVQESGSGKVVDKTVLAIVVGVVVRVPVEVVVVV